MDKTDIIRMAREADFGEFVNMITNPLERFAALVAAHEREACAKVAEAWQTEVLNPRYHCDCATAIRQRKEK